MKTITHTILIITTLLFITSFTGKTFSPQATKCFNSNEIEPPVPVSPVYGQFTSDDTVFFNWTRSGKKMSYEIMISEDGLCLDGKRYASTDTTIKIHFSKKLSGARYWKVRAFKNKTTYSEWSKVSYFNLNMEQQIQINSGCSHNCGSCTHPCGRRRTPNWEIDLKPVDPQKE